jgi:type II secretory ATPase GspE/PulE/Tfp pilus assembly ATPase PilB-like protein
MVRRVRSVRLVALAHPGSLRLALAFPLPGWQNIPVAKSLTERVLGALSDGERPVAAAVETILEEAARAGASDVHFEPGPDRLRLRFRLDGLLHDAGEVPDGFRERVVGRLKVLADLPTYRTDVPQEGRIPAAAAPGGADLRVSVFPTVRGEKAVVRFFRRDSAGFDLDRLGLPAGVLSVLKELASRAQGLLLLTGPAGSGKTTTIYAVVREILRRSGGTRQVVTVEDPVEFEIAGATQTQVNADAGLTFQLCLRSLMRQDPEVILVGEIRDPETARIAVEAAFTGHLVLSTVHAGTAAGVFQRLLEMGIEPHLLSSASPVVLSQRLLRTLCPACKTAEAGGGSRRSGCASCFGTGYRGRRPAADLLVPGPAFREALLARGDEESLARAAGGAGPRAAAEALVAEGATDREEVERVFGRD